MSIQVFFFIAAAMVAFMPTIWDMKVKGKKLNWWTRLTLAGKIYIIAFALFFGTGLYLTVKSHNESITKETISKSKNYQDSIKFELRHQETLERLGFLSSAYERANKSDSIFKVALKRGNYKYDSVKGIIVSPKINIQTVAKDGRGIQNNEANLGNQFLGDIQNLNVNEIRASKQQLDEIVYDTEVLMKKENLTCLIVELNMASNAKALYSQIFKAYKDAGMSPQESSAMTYPMPKKISFRKSEKNCLVVVVGLFD